jgi:hypothetical protein
MNRHYQLIDGDTDAARADDWATVFLRAALFSRFLL